MATKTDGGKLKNHTKFVPQPSSSKKLEEVEVDGSPPTTTAGDLLFTRQWPVTQPRAQIYILHGYAEHCERYERFCELLNEHHYSVATHDHIGHGRSQGHRFHVDHFDTYMRDALELMKEQRQTAPHLPFIVFGHSMGGLVTTLCLLEEPEIFSAAILSSPCLMVHAKYNKPSLRAAAKALSWIAPRFYIPSKSLALDPVDVIADEVERDSYESDPLIWHYGSKPGMTVAMFDAIERVQANLPQLKVKCLVQHGTHDLVCDPAGVEPFRNIDHVAQLKLYEGAKHALLLDTPVIRARVIEDLLQFIDSVVFEDTKFNSDDVVKS